ncbi:MAG: helix-turn-helix domain-containing protein [Propionibacteriales bacterium]|nr:helix-turn-helix domain-containing protein [Propionibacteriales bacterium]
MASQASPDWGAAVTKRPRNTGAAGAAAPPQYPIESVDNALRLLLLFEEEQQVRLTDVSRYLGVATSTAHRLLAILQYRGFVRQDPATRSYEPGPSLSSIAFLAMRHLDVRTRARPTLERLNKEFGETVHLSRLEGTSVNFLDAIEGIRAVRVGSRIGRALPAHCTSSGKAMLSLLDVDELNRLFPGEELDAVTKHTITSRKALHRELVRVRRQGYALSREESEDGVRSVSAPVRGASGVLYAVAVSVPTHRMNTALRTEITTSVVNAAEELGAALL